MNEKIRDLETIKPFLNKRKEIREFWLFFQILLENTQGEKEKLRDFFKLLQGLSYEIINITQKSGELDIYEGYTEDKTFKKEYEFTFKDRIKISLFFEYKGGNDTLRLEFELIDFSEDCRSDTNNELFYCEFVKSSEGANFTKRKFKSFKELTKIIKDLKDLR